MTHWPAISTHRIESETHFGTRQLRCFANRPADLNAMLRAAVERAPDGEAVVSCETRLTYAELAQKVRQLAGGLTSLGVAKGDRVALLLSNRCAFLITLLACQHIGAIAVPINIREGKKELSFILGHCGAKTLFHGSEVAERLPQGLLPPRQMINAETAAFATLCSGPEAEMAAVDEEDTAVILYTSGTTGKPKGAMLTHFNIIHTAMHFELCMGLGAGERSLLCVPASHVTGLIATIFTMIRSAGCTVMQETFEAHAFLDLVATEKVTQTLMVPAMYNLFLLRCTLSDYDLSAWRIGGYGGAPMPQTTIHALAEQLPNMSLMNAYGATELTSAVTMSPLGTGVTRADSIGVALPCVDLRLVDDQGHDVPDGAHGELWIKGPMTVPGYWNNPEKTASEFTPDGYWKSGDVGSRDADGFVSLHDRRKDMIIRGGYNIYSAEVENTLTAHPEVIECAAVGSPDPVLGEKLHVIIYTADAALDTAAIQSFSREHLADYKTPDFVTFTNAPLPRNANGKTLKTKLRQQISP